MWRFYVVDFFGVDVNVSKSQLFFSVVQGPFNLKLV